LSRTGYADGAITIETFEGDIPAHQLETAGLLRVSVGYSGANVTSNVIHSDDYGGALIVVRHLLELGHRQIGVISGPPNFMSAMSERMKGYQQALSEYGLEYNPALVAYGDFTIDSGYAAANQLLNLADRPTALFGMNDRMALGAMRRATELGLRIPTDLSVTGFDDVALAEKIDPPLTTVRQHGFSIGQTAANQLFSLIDNQIQSFDSVVLPVELMIRNSTAPVPTTS
jgi:DNA-binding LacI/PurR family transcriptional regulator